MRKSLIVLVALMMFSFALPAYAADVQVILDGQAVEFTDQKPYIDSFNRAMVPVRAPLEALGAQVDWDNEKRQAILEKDDILIVFTIGSSTYTVNGEAKEMDTQAVISGDRTCIPIRFAAEAMGAVVNWDTEKHIVTINTAKSEDEDETATNPTEEEIFDKEDLTDEKVVDENTTEEQDLTEEEVADKDTNEEEVADEGTEQEATNDDTEKNTEEDTDEEITDEETVEEDLTSGNENEEQNSEETEE